MSPENDFQKDVAPIIPAIFNSFKSLATSTQVAQPSIQVKNDTPQNMTAIELLKVVYPII